MGCLAMTAVAPCAAMTVTFVKRAKMIIATRVFPTAGSATNLIVLAAWKTVQSVVMQPVLRA